MESAQEESAGEPPASSWAYGTQEASVKDFGFHSEWYRPLQSVEQDGV